MHTTNTHTCRNTRARKHSSTGCAAASRMLYCLSGMMRVTASPCVGPCCCTYTAPVAVWGNVLIWLVRKSDTDIHARYSIVCVVVWSIYNCCAAAAAAVLLFCVACSAAVASFCCIAAVVSFCIASAALALVCVSLCCADVSQCCAEVHWLLVSMMMWRPINVAARTVP